MTSSSNPIEHSFELAAAACDDLTPHVHRRLFREHPKTQAMFRTEGSEPVKGSMLSLTIQAIIDFAGERSGHFRLIECEVSSHDARARSAKVEAGFASDRALILNRRMILSPNRIHFGGSCAGTPRELFVAFFAVIAATLREILAEQWSEEIDAAWHNLLSDIEAIVLQQQHLVGETP